MKKYLIFLLVFAISFSLTSTIVFAYTAPSTNDANRTNGWAHVNELSVSSGEIELEFVQLRTNVVSCFEYRTDGDVSQVIDEEHPLEYYGVADESEGLQEYPYFCLSSPGTRVETFYPSEFVEVRLLFGGEGDERFDWTKFELPFERSAEITAPAENSLFSGDVEFMASYIDEDGDDGVAWAIRFETCAPDNSANVAGNVGSFSGGNATPYTWDGADFYSQIDTSAWVDGDYCFIFNPQDDSGEEDLRETRWFRVDNSAPAITLNNPEDGTIYQGIVPFEAVCNEDCDYINFWWTKVSEPIDSADRQYHYVHEDGTLFEWELDTLAPEYWKDDVISQMDDGDYYVYAAGKDLAGNWARSERVMITIDNNPDTKDECKKDGWENYGFKNQGQCVMFIETGKDSR